MLSATWLIKGVVIGASYLIFLRGYYWCNFGRTFKPPPPPPSPPNQGESSVTCMFLSRTSQIQGSQLLVVVLTGRVGFEDA